MDIQSTDFTRQQTGQGREQLYVLKRGVILIDPTEFAGLYAAKTIETSRTYFGQNSGTYINSYDVYHYANNAAPGKFWEDAVVDKLNHYDTSGVIMSASASTKYWVGSPGWVSTYFSISMKAADDSIDSQIAYGPYGRKNYHFFHYILYSQSAISDSVVVS